ncbi:ubiquitin carboxyl-terminal hydrolase 48 isoform X2 [Clupea harengus]|uniref:Ubiquitin carboxyl-terminal hydrolase 48 n=1 Tax=Clupea harengus TaxID=7950 RepID=A0A6P8FFI0_CLUHA|nr:ubiquitin carboxyl-terminal hydrolase 48 isoform X2 [Clupea harengus]
MKCHHKCITSNGSIGNATLRMAPRLQLEKAAWRWVETVKPEDIKNEHIELAYRIALSACQRGTCRNCKGNPNCLIGIGEHLWLGDIDENTFHNIDDPSSERRDKNTFVGLTNLGATCYVNTFLQVWFHNLELRQTLYLCQNAWVESADSEKEPQTICEHLQYLFALLQNSSRRSIDPSGLVKALGLNTGQQQDAQEFSKLFLSLLEEFLLKQKNPNLQNVIQEQFCGMISYVTVCDQCGRSSSLPSRFYELELNIQGHKNLMECLTEFLKEEKLDGDNRYHCESCQTKQNATRHIKLQSLPRTLNLQLMRFVFDRKTGHKKKLNTFINFPEILDMGPFMERKEEKCVFELSAVLIHRGISAYSGHYIAHVRDALSNDWYKFNDEEIEKMEGKKLQLGLEEDIAETVKISQSRKPKCSRGYHCSRNAYMLVYKRQPEQDDRNDTNAVVPEFLETLVAKDNRKFEEWCSELAEMRKQSVDKGKAKHEEVKGLFTLLPVEDGQPYEFVPLDWLKKWLDDSITTKAIDNGHFLCSHGKLHPDKIGEAKRISLKAASLLFSRYGGGPRLDRSSLCRECVTQRCQVLRLKNQLTEDYKDMSILIKAPSQSGKGLWVGKLSLRIWRQLALEQLEDDEEHTKHGDHKTNGDRSNITRSKGAKTIDGEDVDTEGMKIFNEDILCPHGGLNILESERRLVSVEAWDKLKVYFPKAPEFTYQHEPCQQCLRREREDRQNEELNKMMANEQKSALLNLFQEKNRPTLQKWPEETDVLYIVPPFFLAEWRKFIRRPSKSTPVSSVGNSILLCPHGGFMFTHESMLLGDAEHVALLWPDEWEVIRTHFLVDQPISLSRIKAEPDITDRVEYHTRPELCEECREGFMFQQQRDMREYTQATVYVRKVINNKRALKDDAPSLNVSGSEAEEEKETKVDGEKDPDFSQLENGAKRKKIISGVGIAVQHSVSKASSDKGIRRSTRHHKLRGEKALIVSANQTLKELKIQIMHAFSVAPFDQNLSIDGRSLTDDSATLGSLGVTPECVICLKADEPLTDYAAIDDVYQVCLPEEGFKGTGLLGH